MSRSRTIVLGLSVILAVAAAALALPVNSSANDAGSTIQPANSLAPGLVDRFVASVKAPTDVAFTPDGRALITSQRGRLWVVDDGQLGADPALGIRRRMCGGGDRGLLGVAVDPNFAANHWIYLFWTFDKADSCAEIPSPTPVNRVTRFTLQANSVVATGSARLILDNIPSPTIIHNAGDLAFGADGFLYVTTGDGGCEIGSPTECAAANDNSRRLDIPNGKVLRVTRTGGVPAVNPYASDPDGRRCTGKGAPDPGNGPCTETFASGFRNPFRMSMKPGTSTPWVDDVGQNTWEEIDRATAGTDFGWNVREGFCITGSKVDCSPSPFADPVFAYDHTTGCQSITGSAFVPNGAWDGRFAGDLMFGDFICHSIFRLHQTKSGEHVAKPVAPAASPVAMAFGPSTSGLALYYLSYDGELRAITPG